MKLMMIMIMKMMITMTVLLKNCQGKARSTMIIIDLWRTTLVGFCSFMTPFLLPSNPTDMKTMQVS